MRANSSTASPAPADVRRRGDAVVGSWPSIPTAVRPRRSLAVLGGIVAALMTVSCTSWGLGGTAEGYRSADSVLDVYAWQTPAPALSQAFVEGIADRASECDYELYYDSDTDGDGNLDSGGSDVQQAQVWSDSGSAGVVISAESSGGSSQVGKTRLAWRGAVIRLASLTVDGGSDSAAAAATLDTFLRSLAGRLG